MNHLIPNGGASVPVQPGGLSLVAAALVAAVDSDLFDQSPIRPACDAASLLLASISAYAEKIVGLTGSSNWFDLTATEKAEKLVDFNGSIIRQSSKIGKSMFKLFTATQALKRQFDVRNAHFSEHIGCLSFDGHKMSTFRYNTTFNEFDIIEDDIYFMFAQHNLLAFSKLDRFVSYAISVKFVGFEDFITQITDIVCDCSEQDFSNLIEIAKSPRLTLEDFKALLVNVADDVPHNLADNTFAEVTEDIKYDFYKYTSLSVNSNSVLKLLATKGVNYGN